MTTYSSEDVARRILVLYVSTGRTGQVQDRSTLLAQWPKGFTHPELTTALEYACKKGRLEETAHGFMPIPAGLTERTLLPQGSKCPHRLNRKGPAMDFVTLLRRDHEKMSSLFSQIQDGFALPDTPDRHQLFRQLKSDLEVHAAVEDLHVYRVFQQAETTRDGAHDALAAHAKIKTLLDELDAAPTYDHTWVSTFQELRTLVETHVAAEETELFRKTEAIMTAQEAEELGAILDTAKAAIIRQAPSTEGGTPEQA